MYKTKSTMCKLHCTPLFNCLLTIQYITSSVQNMRPLLNPRAIKYCTVYIQLHVLKTRLPLKVQCTLYTVQCTVHGTLLNFSV